MRVVATYGLKGGVGKTSAVVNLAALCASEGRRTLLWDLDPQGSASFLLQAKTKAKSKGGSVALIAGHRELEDAARQTAIAGLDLLAGDLSLRATEQALIAARRPDRQISRALKGVRTHYDVVFLDCPSGVSGLAENVFRAVDILLAPLIPSPLSLRSYDQLMEVLAGLDGPTPSVRPFLSMVDGRKALHRQALSELRERLPNLLTGAVPAASVVERMGVTRRPVVLSHPKAPAAQAYRLLWAELSGLLL